MICGFGRLGLRFHVSRVHLVFDRAVFNCEHADRAAVLVRNYEQVAAEIVAGGRDEVETFGSDVARHCLRIVARRRICDERHVAHVGDVVYHDAALALERHAYVCAAVYGHDLDRFGLGSLLFGTAVKLVVVVAAIEVIGGALVRRGNALYAVAAVVYERHIRGFEHRERAGAEQIRFVRSEAVPLFVVEHFDLGVAVRFLGYALVFFPFAGVALVGGGDIRLAADREGFDAVGHVYAEHFLRFYFSFAVLEHVEAAAFDRVILESERHDRLEFEGLEIEHRDRIGFLQRYVRLAVQRGYVFGFEIDGRLGAFHDDDPGGRKAVALRIEIIEVYGFRRPACGSGGKIDGGDAALRIGAVLVAHAGLALVGGQYDVAGERNHVGLNSRRIRRDVIAVVIEQDNRAARVVILVLHRDRDDVEIGIHSHAGNVADYEAVGKIVAVLGNEVGEVYSVRVLVEYGFRFVSVIAVLAQRHDIDGLRLAVDEIKSAVVGVVFDDLRHAAFGVRKTGVEFRELVERKIVRRNRRVECGRNACGRYDERKCERSGCQHCYCLRQCFHVSLLSLS